MAVKKTAKSMEESTVSLKVVREFIDKTNDKYRKPTQQPFEATPEGKRAYQTRFLC